MTKGKGQGLSLARFWTSLVIVLVLGLFPRISLAQECGADGVCDTHERCSAWKEEGECTRSEAYMDTHCPVSCRGSAEEDPRKTTENSTTNNKSNELEEECKDVHTRCPVWAELGECADNNDMRKYCAKSCDTCDEQAKDLASEQGLCVDSHEECNFWASRGECTNNPVYMLENCAKSCNSCVARRLKVKKTPKVAAAASVTEVTLKEEDILDRSETFGTRQEAKGAEAQDTLVLIAESNQYMKSKKVASLSKAVRKACRNRNALCSFWALKGECDSNKPFMQTNCAPACKTCALIDIQERCPKLDNLTPALQPGSMNKMFERIVDKAPGNRSLTDQERQELKDKNMTEYSVVVHSRPSDSPATDVSHVLDTSLPPWVITFENFITPEECDALIQLGYKHGFKQSEDVGGLKFDGSHDSQKSEGRTSENAWCSQRGGCREEEVTRRIHQRMSDVMNIPPENCEDLQILKYEVGQFYRTHHDYIPHQKDRQCGPRILTFFLYLSDVEAGGGTDFPDLGITVNPKRGRALLWPSVYDSNPLTDDRRMRHQALPVEAGTKFAANGWIHMHDYVSAQERGCN